MNSEDIIQNYRLGFDSRIKFKGDPQEYWIRNISPDRKNVFVTINGAQTYRKLIKNIIQVGNKMIKERFVVKEGKSLKDLIKQKIEGSKLPKTKKDQLLKRIEDPKELNKVLMDLGDNGVKENKVKRYNATKVVGILDNQLKTVKDQLEEFVTSSFKKSHDDKEYEYYIKTKNYEDNLNFFAENIIGILVNNFTPDLTLESNKVDIQSTLAKVLQDVWAEKDLTKAKKLVTDYLATSKIKAEDNKKMQQEVENIKSKPKLDYFLANALLKYEGSGVSQLRKQVNESKKPKCQCQH